MWGDDWGTMIWGGGAPVPTLGPLGWLLLGALMGAAVVLYRRPILKTGTALALVALVLVPLVALAVTLPNTFVNGTVADADEVNENFQFLADKIAALEAAGGGRLFAGQTSVATDGNAGGYLGADALCDGQFPGAVLCSSQEVLESLRQGIALPSTQGRVREAAATSSAPVMDCLGFTTTDQFASSVLWSPPGFQLSNCNGLAPLLCCAVP